MGGVCFCYTRFKLAWLWGLGSRICRALDTGVQKPLVFFLQSSCSGTFYCLLPMRTPSSSFASSWAKLWTLPQRQPPPLVVLLSTDRGWQRGGYAPSRPLSPVISMGCVLCPWLVNTVREGKGTRVLIFCCCCSLRLASPKWFTKIFIYEPLCSLRPSGPEQCTK